MFAADQKKRGHNDDQTRSFSVLHPILTIANQRGGCKFDHSYSKKMLDSQYHNRDRFLRSPEIYNCLAEFRKRERKIFR